MPGATHFELDSGVTPVTLEVVGGAAAQEIPSPK